MVSILLFLAIVPVVIILTYIYLKDRNKEPWPLLLKLFILGICSCALVLLLSELLFVIFPFMKQDTSFMTFFEVMAYSFIGVALVEEFCKWLMSYLGAYFHKAYDEVYDGIVYAVYVSLGFACLENILYVLMNNSLVVGISRGLLAVPGHACDAVFMGYYLSLAKVYASQGKKKLEKKNLVLSVVVPTILHGIYDFCLFSNIALFLIIFFIFVIAMYIFSIKKIKLLASKCKNAHNNSQQNGTYITREQQNVSEYSNYQQPQHSGNMVLNHQQSTGNINASQYLNSGYINSNQQQAGYINPPQYVNSGYITPNSQQSSGYIYPQQYTNTGYNQNQANGFCPKCQMPMNGSFCLNCNTRQN